MKFVMFRRPTSKKFNYKPRFYSPEKEAIERRRAEMGVETELSEQEQMRMRMSARWRQKNPVEFGNKYKLISFISFGSVAIAGIYIIFFTDLIDNLIRAFGIGK